MGKEFLEEFEGGGVCNSFLLFCSMNRIKKHFLHLLLFLTPRLPKFFQVVIEDLRIHTNNEQRNEKAGREGIGYFPAELFTHWPKPIKLLAVKLVLVVGYGRGQLLHVIFSSQDSKLDEICNLVDTLFSRSSQTSISN